MKKIKAITVIFSFLFFAAAASALAQSEPISIETIFSADPTAKILGRAGADNTLVIATVATSQKVDDAYIDRIMAEIVSKIRVLNPESRGSRSSKVLSRSSSGSIQLRQESYIVGSSERSVTLIFSVPSSESSEFFVTFEAK
jgi:hypothetical protein